LKKPLTIVAHIAATSARVEHQNVLLHGLKAGRKRGA